MNDALAGAAGAEVSRKPMESSRVIAFIRPCEQYRYRVELPADMTGDTVAGIRSRAICETNAIFIECTRRFQQCGWVGAANVAFADSGSSPRDSTSALMHLLIGLKTVELSLEYHQQGGTEIRPGNFEVFSEVPLGREARINFKKMCKELGVKLVVPDDGTPVAPMPGVGGKYRSPRNKEQSFACQPVKAITELRSKAKGLFKSGTVARSLVVLPFDLANGVSLAALAAVRMIFCFFYRRAAIRLLDRVGKGEILFPYIELRSGRNRNTAAYWKWKFGDTLEEASRRGWKLVPFGHLNHGHHTLSVSAMVWAGRHLAKMFRHPSEGCIVANFLITPRQRAELRKTRNEVLPNVSRRLEKMRNGSEDRIARLLYGAFMETLEWTSAYPIELSECYRILFRPLPPGVIIQADAVAKTSRIFTARARKMGSKVVYVADRICTDLRLSNKLIGGRGSNPHYPDRFVVFDRVSHDELLANGVDEGRIHTYRRIMEPEGAADRAALGKERSQVLIFLQDYKDNMVSMIEVGIDIAVRIPHLEVLYQEHPSFPVDAMEKAELLRRFPTAVRFVKAGEVDYGRVLATITGYSTAAVPGLMQGVPLIWLRKQVDNSIYGEAYLSRIGTAADSNDDVIEILRRLIQSDEKLLAATLAASAEARSIFNPPGAASSLDEVLISAISSSFAEIASAPSSHV